MADSQSKVEMSHQTSGKDVLTEKRDNIYFLFSVNFIKSDYSTAYQGRFDREKFQFHCVFLPVFP